MDKIYNTQEEIASKIKEFLQKSIPNIRKTQLNIIPYIIIGMILSESSVASDISKQLKDEFSLVKHESVVKRIKRLFNNKLFDPYDFYDKIIKSIISSYKLKHSDRRVHVIFDHMFSHDNYTVFMITMRVGKQGIPLWFRCFKGKSDPNAFNISFLKDGITHVSNLFKNTGFELIFLADRWFNSTELLSHIESLGHTYCVRLKGYIKVYLNNNGIDKCVRVQKISSQKTRTKHFKNVPITDNKYITNIVISSNENVKEPWIIVTNGDSKRAIRDYSYRYGGIETVFKNQKSNGFYIEDTVKANLKYFESMYTLVCFSTLFLVIFGADYTKNTKVYEKHKLDTHRKINGKLTRIISLFNIGLKLFKRAFNSRTYIRIPFLFTLYDV